MSLLFGDRLAGAFEAHGRLCVGIDPHSFLLEEWGLPDTAEGARELALRTVDAAAASVGIVKPQIAFFERFGSAGYAVLEETIRSARASGLLVIADVKRGEIGSSMAGYAAAWITPGSPLEADALTVNPYLGVDSLDETVRTASGAGKGVIVLSATSNPEAPSGQQALGPDGRTVARGVVDRAIAWNAGEEAPYGSVGVVIGATQSLADFGLDDVERRGPVLPVLAPGFGHQGADPADAESVYGALSEGVIVSESRSILSAGPSGIDRAVSLRAEEVRRSLVR